MLQRSVLRVIRKALSSASTGSTGANPASVSTLKSLQIRTATTLSSSASNSSPIPLILAQRWASTKTAGTAKKPAAKKAAATKKPVAKKAAPKKPVKKVVKKKAVKAKAKAKPKKKAVKKPAVKKVVKKPADHKRPNVSGLAIFMAERAPAYKDAAEYKDLRGAERLKAVGDQLRSDYKALSDDEKNVFKIAALRERIRRGASPDPYLKLAVPGLADVGPFSSYLIFSLSKQTGEIAGKEQKEAFQLVGQRAKATGQEWRGLSASDKKKFEDQAAANKKASEQAIDKWLDGLSAAALKELKEDLERGRRINGYVYKAVKARS